MKLKIDNESLFEEFFEHTQLIGIIAPIKSYQFIWNINELLGYQFKINHDLEIGSIRKKGIIISLFMSFAALVR